jgi:hypothetical protein
LAYVLPRGVLSTNCRSASLFVNIYETVWWLEENIRKTFLSEKIIVKFCEAQVLFE